MSRLLQGSWDCGAWRETKSWDGGNGMLCRAGVAATCMHTPAARRPLNPAVLHFARQRDPNTSPALPVRCSCQRAVQKRAPRQDE